MACAGSIRARRLHKRALDLPARTFRRIFNPGSPQTLTCWRWWRTPVAAQRAGLPQGGLLLDFPARSSMLGVDLPLRTRHGTIERLTDAGRAGQLGFPRVGDELYRSARRLRIFVSSPPSVSLDPVSAPHLPGGRGETADRRERGNLCD